MCVCVCRLYFRLLIKVVLLIFIHFWTCLNDGGFILVKSNKKFKSGFKHKGHKWLEKEEKWEFKSYKLFNLEK